MDLISSLVSKQTILIPFTPGFFQVLLYIIAINIRDAFLFLSFQIQILKLMIGLFMAGKVA